MKSLRTACFYLLLVTFAGLQTAWLGESDKDRPPVTHKEPVTEVLHGVEITDPYRWLEDQQRPQTRQWIDAQNAYTESLLANLPRREILKQRLASLMKVDDVDMPVARNGRYFFTKRLADQDLSVIHMRQGLAGKDEVLIDPHGMSDDYSRSVGLRAVSDDGRLLVYAIREGGEDEVEIRILDVDRRQDLSAQWPKARYFGMEFTPDQQWLYYTRHGEEGSRVFFHKMGSSPANDQQLFGEGYGPGKIIFASLSEDGRYLVVHVLHGSAGRTEIHLKDLSANDGFVKVVDELEARTFGQVAGGRLFLQTDWNAPNKRIVVLDPSNLPDSPSQWQDLIPESEATLTGFSLAGGHVFVNYLEDVVSTVKVFQPDGERRGVLFLLFLPHSEHDLPVSSRNRRYASLVKT